MRIMRVSAKSGASWLWLLDANGKILEVAHEIRDAVRIDGWIERIKPESMYVRRARDNWENENGFRRHPRRRTA